jgi:hypothetical protein
MKTEISTYEQTAIDFLTKTNTEFKAEYLKYDYHFAGDKDKRDIYKITLKRGSRSYSFDFGQSIVNSGFKFKLGSGREINLDIPENQRDHFLKSKSLYDLIKYTVEYGGVTKNDKIIKPKEPNCYDVLACLTKYDPGTFENFCSEFGYDEDSKRAEKTYRAVKDEYQNLCALFTDEEMNLMSEIN